MDSTSDNTYYEEDVEKTNRTLWVGNLHPKVSHSNVAELFYQVGPIEYVEFAFDEQDIRENFAWVVFKYPRSVQDSIKLLRGTKLYGLPIITKNYSEHLNDPVFHEQLNYFKQMANVERSNPSNNKNESRWNNQRSDNKINIPESLPEPPVHDINRGNYGHKLDTMPRNIYKEKYSRYQHSNPNSKSCNPLNIPEHNLIDKSHHSHRHFQKSEHNKSSGSMDSYNNDWDTYRNQNYGYKRRDYNVHTSSNWNESTYQNQEPLFMNKHNIAKDVLPVRDLRDTMYRKRYKDSENHSDTNANAACTSLLDLRDTMYQSKSSRYEDAGQYYEIDYNNQRPERNHKNTRAGSRFSDTGFRKNKYTSEQYNESNNRHQNHYRDEEYFNQSFNQDKPYDSFQGNEYSNNYNDIYIKEQNRANNYKYNNRMHPQNIESSSRQHSHHPYKRNDEGYERKEFKNAYDEWSHGHGRSRNYNKEDNDQSRQSFYKFN